MNTRFLACFIGVVAALAAWLLLGSHASPPVLVATGPLSAASPAPAVRDVVPASAPKPLAAPQVAAPKVAPVAPPAKSTVVVDNQKELSTAIPELVRYIQSGDLVTAWQTYARPEYFAQFPPERHTVVDDHLRSVATTDAGRARLQIMSQVLDSFNAQMPTLSDAGDVATYQVSGPAAAAGFKQVRFQKVDGRWYIADDDLGQIGRLLGL